MSVRELTVLTSDCFRIGIRQKTLNRDNGNLKTVYVKYVKI